MGRKLQLLELVKDKVTLFSVPRFFKLNASNYEVNEVFDAINERFTSDAVVVRSSAGDEDLVSSTLAGEYDSILNIPSNSNKRLINAINTVIASYKKKRPLLPNDCVIIQEMVKSVNMSGVIFTHDMNTGAPYYVVNYDDQSGMTDTVTSGNGEYSNRTLYIHRNSIGELRSDRFIRLLKSVQELEKIMKCHFLDIEFALGADLTPYLLQVRSITTQSKWDKNITKKINKTLQEVSFIVNSQFDPLYGVYGKTTVFGQMPDWNPVEMIGRTPRALSASLYQVLITDNAWKIARESMGYAVPIDQPLMVMLGGQPFIDTRLSFHSFIPKCIPSDIAEKLVSHWIERLKLKPELHDKVEFKVAITNYSFSFDLQMDELIGDVLTKQERKIFKHAHLKQTIKLIKGDGEGSCKEALTKINLLNKEQTKHSKKSDKQKKLAEIFGMVEECIQLGTIPFSILARHGFIAKSILLSLNQLNIISDDDLTKIQKSINTVASDLINDMDLLQSNKISYDKFMSKYGHLRPGTYDILSNRYDKMENFIDRAENRKKIRERCLFEFAPKQKKLIDKLLEKNGFNDFYSDDLLDYIRESTIGREYGKFVFTRSVSNILENIAYFAEKNGLSRDEISHIPLSALLEVFKNRDQTNIKEKLKNISNYEAEKHSISIAIRLPQLLTDRSGVYIIPFQVSQPNFITKQSVVAPVVFIDSMLEKSILNGNIVIIEYADPGFDWIFSHKIEGLITRYGGINSHMAIRCAEFNIPAAIGCGDQYFEKLLNSSKVHLNCSAGTLNAIH